jgi:pimeloyl-ACP methyl ester carboxylesterase
MVWVFVIGGLAVLAVVLLLVFRRRRPVARPAAEEWEVVTKGATWRGVRYRNPGFPPIVLVHGYAGNSRNWRDLGYALFERGFDVWMPNLRGHGKGTHRSLALGGEGVHSFDAIALEDYPALVDYIVSATGRKAALVAHSMGGIAARAYLAGIRKKAEGSFEVDPERARKLAKEKVSCLILMGSPPHFRNCSPALKFLLKQPRSLVEWLNSGVPIPDAHAAPTSPDTPKRFGWIRNTAFSKMVGGITSASALRGVVNVTNFDPTTAEFPRLLRKGISKVHVDLVRDVHRWVGHGDILSRCGFDFTKAEAIFVPMLFIAGEYDGLAPWEDVFDAAERHSVHAPTWKLLVRRTSHVDLIAGARAARLVAPWVAKFASDPSSLGSPGSRHEI